jgi:squalene-hopene/tetraprenyl-beta-curcumene cyclase
MLDASVTRLTKEQRLELDATIRRAQDNLLDSQYAEGYWWGELESNPTMEAEYLLLTQFLGLQDEERWRRLTNYILSRQRSDGTWGQYYDAPGDLSTSTECYFALKLAGFPADDPRMVRARDFILSKGGVPNTRVFTKVWLSLFGQWEWSGVPVMPAEMMLLPNWSPLNIYDFASWARATIVPMIILLDRKPVREIPDSAHIDELYPLPRSETNYSIGRPKKLMGWDTLFYAGDGLLRRLDKLPWKPTRGQAIKRAEQWVLEHQDADGSWGGIQPPWVYSLMALSSLGYPSDHPVIAKGMAGFENFAIQEGDTLRMQACVSPLWDTGLAMIALLDSGLPPDHAAMKAATRYLVDEQIVNGGDWQVRARGVPPGGWAFEFHNDVYPDIDDTAEIVMALDRAGLAPTGGTSAAIDRAVAWTLGMQCNNGGWGAFDKNNTKTIIAKIPFLDFGEVIDPPSVDVTAHVLEMLGQLGYDAQDPAVKRALHYVMSEQEDDGPWFGRWGVNYIYGAGAVLPALEAVGFDMSTEPVRRTVGWIVDHQNSDGGWGESCMSYVDPDARGRGPSTPSQTAWALLALIAAGDGSEEAAERGVRHLVETQQNGGSWDEAYFTGTGFPGYGVGQRPERTPESDDPRYQSEELSGGFMINYHMYRSYWPLMALGRYRTFVEGGRPKRYVSTAAGGGGASLTDGVY